MKSRLLIVAVLTVLITASCGEVSWQRKYKLEVLIHDSPGANVALLLELPEISKKYDTNPNIPLDISVPLIPKDFQASKRDAAPERLLPIPSGEGSFIYIWSAKQNKTTKIPAPDLPKQ